MRLTNRSEYALLALVHIARYSDRPISVAEISSAQKIPLRFLEQIVSLLRRHRLLTSNRGRAGGYRLARAPAQITLAEIVRCLEGPLAPTDSTSRFFYRATPSEREPGLRRVLKKVRDATAEIMEGCTLADVIEKERTNRSGSHEHPKRM